MGRKCTECPPVEEMYLKISSILVPDYILRDFDIYGDKENKSCWVIEMREKSGRIPDELSEYQDVVFEPKNIGEQMSIDDKAIGRDGYTILSNTKTGKIAMMIESTQDAKEIMNQVFSKYKKLKIAYDLSQNFKQWYDINSYKKDKISIRDNL